MLGRGIRFSIISTTMSKVLFTLLINLTCAPFVAWSTSKRNSVSRQVFSNISVVTVARAAAVYLDMLEHYAAPQLEVSAKGTVSARWGASTLGFGCS